MARQDIVIAPGMDQSTDPRMLPPGTPRLLQNFRVRQRNRFEKRPGEVATVTTGLPTAGEGGYVGEHNSLPTIGVEETLSSVKARTLYSLSDNATFWQLLGRHGVVVPERRFGLTRDVDDNVKFMSCAVVSGTMFVSWTDRPGGTVSYIAAVDPSGTVLRKTSFTADKVRLIYANSVLYAVYAIGTQLNARVVVPTTCSFSGSSTVIGTLNASGSSWDAAALENGTTWFLAYPNDATHITEKLMAGTSVSVSGTFVTTNEATRIGVAGYVGNSVAIGYTDGTQEVKCFIGSDTTLAGVIKDVYSTGGTEDLHWQVCPVYVSSGTYCVTWGGVESSSAPAIASSYFRHVRITSSSVPTSQKVWHFQPASRPFTFGAVGARQVLIWAHNSTDSGGSQWGLQASHYVLELQSATQSGGGANLCAVSYEHLATFGSSVNHNSALTEVASFGSGRYGVPLMWDDPGTPGQAGIDVAIFRAALCSDSLRWGAHRFTDEVNSAIYISGGCLYEVDDSAHVDTHYIPENGFPYAPQIAVVAAAGGSLTSGKLYSYIAIYRWQDAWGHIHRSAPSAVATVTPSGGNLTTTVKITTLSASGRMGSTGIAPVADVYRSWDGGPYYYVGTSGSCIATAIAVTLTDSNSDAVTAAHTPAYSNGTPGSILPNEPPSGARLMAKGAERMCVVGWNAKAGQFSKLFIPSAPVEFNDDDAFRSFIPEDITALAYMDGAWVFFSAKSIYLVTGDGPDDTGGGAGFSVPRELPSAVGCDDARSVVVTPQGVMFQAAGTLWLLPRGFGPPVRIGDPVWTELGDYSHILGAAMVANADDECVHFMLADTDVNQSSRAVVYNLAFGSWTLDLWSGSFNAAANVGGAWTSLMGSWSSTSYLPVRQFSTASYQDYSAIGAAAWIQYIMGFGDWRPAGPCGVGHLHGIVMLGQFAGVSASAPSLTFGLTSDGTAETARTFTVLSGTADAEFYRMVTPTKQTGTSWRLDVYDAYGGSYSAAPIINAFAIETREEDGIHRPDAQERL